VPLLASGFVEEIFRIAYIETHALLRFTLYPDIQFPAISFYFVFIRLFFCRFTLILTKNILNPVLSGGWELVPKKSAC